MKKLSALLGLTALAFLSCRMGPVMETATVSVRLELPAAPAAQEAGFARAAMDALGLAEGGARAFDPQTTRFWASITAPDIFSVITASKSYVAGQTSVDLTIEGVPVGQGRLITLRGLDGANGILTEGTATIDIVGDQNNFAHINMRPMAPTALLIGPDGTNGTVAAGNAAFYSVSVTTSGIYRISLAYYGESLLENFALYGSDGARVSLNAASMTPGAATYGRTPALAVGTYYIAAIKPVMDTEAQYRVIFDVDWRAVVTNPALEGVLDSRSPFDIAFPNSLGAATVTVDGIYNLAGGDDMTRNTVTADGSGATRSISKTYLGLQLDWTPDDYKVITVSFTDPILTTETTRIIDLPPINAKPFYFTAPDAAPAASPSPPPMSRAVPGLFSEAGTYVLSAGQPAMVIMESGDYLESGYETGRVTITDTVQLLGGWNGAATGAIVRTPATAPTRLMMADHGEMGPFMLIISGNGVNPNETVVDGLTFIPPSTTLDTSSLIDRFSIVVTGYNALPVIRNSRFYTRNTSITGAPGDDYNCVGAILVTNQASAIIYGNVIGASDFDATNGLLTNNGTSTQSLLAAGIVFRDLLGNPPQAPMVFNNVIRSPRVVNSGPITTVNVAAIYINGGGSSYADGYIMGNTLILAPQTFNMAPNVTRQNALSVNMQYGYIPRVHNNILLAEGTVPAGTGAIQEQNDAAMSVVYDYNDYFGFPYLADYMGVQQADSANTFNLDPALAGAGYATGNATLRSSGTDPIAAITEAALAVYPFLRIPASLDLSGASRTAPFAIGAYE